MLLKLDTTVRLEDTTCCSCGVFFAIPDYLMAKRREDGKAFYCPNGHSLVFTESEAQKAKKELEREKQRREMAEREAMQERKLREDADAKLARAKKRADAGVCQHCQRSFANVARHMATKHGAHA